MFVKIYVRSKGIKTIWKKIYIADELAEWPRVVIDVAFDMERKIYDMNFGN